MKTNYLTGLITIFLFSVSTFAFGIGAIVNIPGAQTVVPGKVSDVPQFIRFSEAEAISVSEFPKWAAKYFGLAPEYNFHLINATPDQIGFVHYRYIETFNGFPVEGTMYILHSKNARLNDKVGQEKIISMNGEIFNSISSGAIPLVSEHNALANALSNINASVYKWQIPAEESHIKTEQKNNSATYFPKGELVYVSVNGNFSQGNLRLAWKFDVYASEPLSRNYIYVDASTGAVIHKVNRIETADVTGSAITAYSGTRPIVTDNSVPGSYRLQETGRGNGINTYDLQRGTNYANAIDFTDADNTWNNVNANKDQYATDAHWGAEMTYDFYLLKFNRHSIDDMDYQLNNYVHYSTNYVNAFWDGNVMTFGDGNATYTPLTAIDVIGHEITHGFTQFTANLNGGNEPGALNEGFSDCFGISIRYYGKQPATIDWVIGDEIGGAPFRDCANPSNTSNPDTYQGTDWDFATQEVHQNSTVLSHCYYLVTVGGNGTNDLGHAYNVTGIGLTKAEQIWYRMQSFYLFSSAQYADARTYSILAAQDIYGACSPEVITVTNAWYAVGVGGLFSAVVTPNFTADITTSCTVPFTANFSNTSTNAGTYIWNFGDGSPVSTATNPSHTYAAYGNFTVRLYADGGTCGNDSLIRTSYINLTDMTPVATGVTVCKWSTPTLTATGTPAITWYSNSVGGTPLFTGSSFTTPPVTASTNYYVESAIAGPNGYVGPPDSSLGGGGNHNNNSTQYLTFTVLQPCTLHTAVVYAYNAGDRTFILMDNAGIPIQSYTVNVPAAGMNTITLDIPLTAGSFRIGGTMMNLYRNSAGAVYPYNLSSLVNITGSSATGRYYFLYHWNIQTPSCITTRITVPVTVDLENQSLFNYSNVANNYTFTDNSTTATSWFWSFGDLITSTQQNPVHMFLTPSGVYTVMHVVYDATCTDTSYQTINVINGIEELSGMNTTIYPNPATNELRIKNAELRITEIKIYDMLGQKVFSQPQTSNLKPETIVDVSALTPGVYSIEVIAGDKKGTGRFVKE